MGADTKGPRPIGREVLVPGPRAARWTGDNRDGRRVSSGVHFTPRQESSPVPTRPAVIAILSLAACPASAATIPGTAPADPTARPRTYEIHLGNDFFGRGGAFDDFRTQQLVFAARIADVWSIVVDHSVLTLDESTDDRKGRLDQISGSIVRCFADACDGPIDTARLGLGFRRTGRFAGERIQNGAHRLLAGSIKDLPYVGTRRTDLTLWARLERTRTLWRGDAWELDYHALGIALVGTDGQSDGTGALFGVLSRSVFHAWLGLRGDWRAGHDRDPVQAETARAERGAFGVFGLRIGPILGESSHKLDGDGAFGRFSLVATGETRPASPPRGVGFQAGLTIPDVQASFQARRKTGGPLPGFVLTELRYGRPQYEDSPREFVETWQLRGGYEVERPWPNELVTGYVALVAGWRRERLRSDGEPDGEASSSVDRGVVGMDVGFRVVAAGEPGGRHFGIQTGLTGTLPFSDATVEFANGRRRVQRPELVLSLGMRLRL